MLAQTPVGGTLVNGIAYIPIAGAGVVDADVVAAFATQGGVQRHVGRLAKNVPQRDVNGRVAARLGAGATPAQVAGELPVAGFDRQRVFAQQLRAGPLMDVSLHRLRTHKGFTQTDQSLVGVDAHPHDVGELIEPQGFNFGNFQFTLQKKPQVSPPAAGFHDAGGQPPRAFLSPSKTMLTASPPIVGILRS